MKTAPTFCHAGYTLRLGRAGEAEAYYQHNFANLDPDVIRLTGCKPVFSEKEVVDFFNHCLEADDRYDFMLVEPSGQIVGEVVINGIDPELNAAELRICLFHPQVRNHGIGRFMMNSAVQFAFETLGVHRLELDVYDFNTRARHLYESCGFKLEGRRRDAVKDGDTYADDLIMSQLANEYFARQ